MKPIPVEQAITLLQDGGVGVMPTDTVYGLVARAADEQAVAKLYGLKHREHKPGTVIAASVEQLVELGVPKRYLSAVQHLWPNPLSVEIQLGQRLTYLHQETGRQAYRVVANEKVRQVLEQTGPLLTSSANQPGQPGSVTVKEATDYFQDQVDFYVDGGDLTKNLPSTIIKVIDDAIEVIRPGAIAIDESGRITSKQGCAFCRSNQLLKGDIIAETSQGRGAYLIESYDSKGNYLIIPTEHVEDPARLSDGWWHEFSLMLQRVPSLSDSYNISLNYGKLSGQTARHLHFWIVKRYSDQPASGKGLAGLISLVNDSKNVG